MLFHLLELLESNEWGCVVVDGPSTSHVIRLLEHPTNVPPAGRHRARREDLAALEERAAATAACRSTAYATRLEALAAFFRDPKRFQFYLCTIAEPVAEAQTRLLMRVLTEQGIPVAEIIADMIEDGKGSREVENRRGLQAPSRAQVPDAPPDGRAAPAPHRRAPRPRRGEEVRQGVVERQGDQGAAVRARPRPRPRWCAPRRCRPSRRRRCRPRASSSSWAPAASARVSCAAAAAVTLTEKEGPVLLISTDPSHSLSDVLLEPPHRHRDPGEGHQGPLRARDRLRRPGSAT